MRRVLVLTWALGTATGVLLGLFGVQLVSSRFSTAGVSPMSRPEVLRALQAARAVPTAADEVALPASPAPDTAVPPPSPPVDAAPARPSAESTSSPAPAPPARTLPRPGATAGSFVEAAASSTTSTAPAPAPTTTTTEKAVDFNSKPKSDQKGSTRNDRGSTTTSSSSATTTTTSKKTTTTTTPPAPSSKPPAPSPQPAADTRTISSAGGVVAVRYSGGKVELRWARPNAGYEVYVRSNGPDQVVVYFYKQGQASQVRAYYKDGAPSSDVVNCAGSYPNIKCS